MTLQKFCLTEVNVVMSESDRYFLLSNSQSIDDRVRKSTEFTSNNNNKKSKSMVENAVNNLFQIEKYLFRENTLERKMTSYYFYTIY